MPSLPMAYTTGSVAAAASLRAARSVLCPVPLFCARRGSMPCSMLYRTCFSRRRLLCSMAKRIESVHVSP